MPEAPRTGIHPCSNFDPPDYVSGREGRNAREGGQGHTRAGEGANEFDELAAAVAYAEHLFAAAQPASPPAGKRGKPGIRGHGAKFSANAEEAVTALLTKRSFSAAASAAGITRQTLNRWVEEPAFLARLRAAAHAIFAEGMRWAQQKESDAVNVILTLVSDRGTADKTHPQANRYLTREVKAQVIEDQDERTGAMEDAVNAGGMEAEEAGKKRKTPGRDFYRRLKRIRASLSSPDNPSVRIGCYEDPETSRLIGPGGGWCKRTQGGGWSEPARDQGPEPPYGVAPEKEAA